MRDLEKLEEQVIELKVLNALSFLADMYDHVPEWLSVEDSADLTDIWEKYGIDGEATLKKYSGWSSRNIAEEISIKINKL